MRECLKQTKNITGEYYTKFLTELHNKIGKICHRKFVKSVVVLQIITPNAHDIKLEFRLPWVEIG